MRTILLIAVAVVVVVGLFMVLAPNTAQTPTEQVGQAVDDAATAVGNAAQEAVDAAEDTVTGTGSGTNN